MIEWGLVPSFGSSHELVDYSGSLCALVAVSNGCGGALDIIESSASRWVGKLVPEMVIKMRYLVSGVL